VVKLLQKTVTTEAGEIAQRHGEHFRFSGFHIRHGTSAIDLDLEYYSPHLLH